MEEVIPTDFVKFQILDLLVYQKNVFKKHPYSLLVMSNGFKLGMMKIQESISLLTALPLEQYLQVKTRLKTLLSTLVEGDRRGTPKIRHAFA